MNKIMLVISIALVMLFANEASALNVMRVNGSVTHRSINRKEMRNITNQDRVNSSRYIFINNKKRGGEQDEEKDKAE